MTSPNRHAHDGHSNFLVTVLHTEQGGAKPVETNLNQHKDWSAAAHVTVCNSSRLLKCMCKASGLLQDWA